MYGQTDYFLGIPFAQPPIGPLRYAKPQPLIKFPQSPFNASKVLQCPQAVLNASETSEDCLSLNIYSPNVATTTNYPVLVWIHGGALVEGGSLLNIEGTARNILSRGVLIVSIQYRLGFLGFFTTFTDDFPPNLRLLDQVLALKWVQEEVSNFGGDAAKVTIGGQSAGSASVNSHTYSPLSKGLFHQAIQESGTVLTCFDGALGPTYRNFKFAQLACNYTSAMWNSGNYGPLKDCLMNISIADGLRLGTQSQWGIGNDICWNIVQDNNFFPGTPAALWKNRKNIPVLVGTNRDEQAIEIVGNLYYNKSFLSNFTQKYCEEYLQINYINYFQNMSKKEIDLLEALYIKRGRVPTNLDWLQFTVDFQTGFVFTANQCVDIMYHVLNNNTNVYAYEFTYPTLIEQHGFKWVVPGWYPVYHGAELTFLWMGGWKNYQTAGLINATDITMANFFGESWTNFIKYGKPTMNDTWKPTTSPSPTSMEYLDISGLNMQMKKGYRIIDRVYLNRASPVLVGVMPPYIPDYNNGSIVPISLSLV